jgi:hypothetical protein
MNYAGIASHGILNGRTKKRILVEIVLENSSIFSNSSRGIITFTYTVLDVSIASTSMFLA